jgi:hypothetical protein
MGIVEDILFEEQAHCIITTSLTIYNIMMETSGKIYIVTLFNNFV